MLTGVTGFFWKLENTVTIATFCATGFGVRIAVPMMALIWPAARSWCTLICGQPGLSVTSSPYFS